jgi:hypothetical protein
MFLVLVKEVKEGKKPNAAELYLDTHFKKHPGREPQPVSKKAAEVMVTLSSLFTSYLLFRAEFRLKNR